MALSEKIACFFRSRVGVTGVTYALLIGLISAGVLLSVNILGTNASNVLGIAQTEISNAATSSGAGSGGAGSSNTPPSISDISDASTIVDGTYGPTGFTISDAETAAGSLSVSASSSNQTLVPDANIMLGGADGSRTITISPAAGQSGSATITVTVDDGTDTASDTFVLSVNTPPTISDIADATIGMDGTYGPTGFTISDAETAAGSLSVSASSSNQTLVPDANITLGGADGSRTIEITPAASQNGSATITVTVDDGVDTTNDTFVLTVLTVSACSGSLPPGTSCYLDGQEIVFVGNYDPQNGGGSRPLYVTHCDNGMSWNGSSCTGSRVKRTWNAGNTDYVNTPVANDTYPNGYSYTNTLVATDSSLYGGFTSHVAAQTCRNLGSVWFLPGRTEMVLIRNNAATGVLNGTFNLNSANGDYWSSSEHNTQTAWRISATDATTASVIKNQSLIIRCARRS